ncbi:MAG: BlaI/MecI/CopY family transcriptional regulator [Bryobacterales bacterium]|nr:BlaI/MecI/CopY family transcriptional regulator [Bryobacterales bacterium]
MPRHPLNGLSRREREIMDVLFRAEKLSAAEIRDALQDAPSYSAVRALLRTLEDKGQIRHEEEGLRYVYFPVAAKDGMAKSAVAHLLHTFFKGSAETAVAALLDVSAGKLSNDELDRMAQMIDKARKEGR